MKNYIKTTFKTKDEWLKAKNKTIGGSEAAMVVNKSAWGSAYDLYKKFVYDKAKKVQENENMKEGTIAEQHIRTLFALDRKDIKVKNPPKRGYWFFQRKDKPYISCTPDGLAINDSGKLWGIEIKDVDLIKREVKDIWESNTLPDQYYFQCLQYLLVFGEMEGVVLVAHQKYYKYNEETNKWDFDYAVERQYKVYRKDVKSHLDYLEKKETEFVEKNIKGRIRPKTIIHI